MKHIADPLTHLEQETYRDSMQDGLMFVFTGLMLVILGNLFGYPLIQAVALLTIFIIFPRGSELLRRRYVYPRVGYVKPKSSNNFEIIPFVIFISSVLIIAGLTVALLPEGYRDTDNLYRIMPFLLGMVFFGPALDVADRTGQDRYLLMGLLPTISGLLITVLSVSATPWPAYRGLLLFTSIWGLTSFIVGVVLFWLFVTTHVVEEYTDDEQIE